MHSEMGHSALLGGMGSIFIHKHTVWLFVDFYRGPVWTFMESGCIALLVERERMFTYTNLALGCLWCCAQKGALLLCSGKRTFSSTSLVRNALWSCAWKEASLLDKERE